MVIQINDSMLELALDTFKGNHVRMPKMMLPATQTSCLKDTHTKDNHVRMPKNDAASNTN